MKLSEAIRLGAMLHGQCFGAMYIEDPSGIVATCALGAAQEAGFDFCDRLREAVDVPCPVCGVMSIDYAIPHLNDDHRWTREAIADWVATLEPPEAVDAVREDMDEPVVATRV